MQFPSGENFIESPHAISDLKGTGGCYYSGVISRCGRRAVCANRDARFARRRSLWLNHETVSVALPTRPLCKCLHRGVSEARGTLAKLPHTSTRLHTSQLHHSTTGNSCKASTHFHTPPHTPTPPSSHYHNYHHHLHHHHQPSHHHYHYFHYHHLTTTTTIIQVTTTISCNNLPRPCSPSPLHCHTVSHFPHHPSP